MQKIAEEETGTERNVVQLNAAEIIPAETTVSKTMPEFLEIPKAPPHSTSHESSDERLAAPTAPQSMGSVLPAVAAFSFVLGKPDGVPLGVKLSPVESGLLVEGIELGGIVETWNQHCPYNNCRVFRGDVILALRRMSRDPQALIDEDRTRQALHITVMSTPLSIRLMRVAQLANTPPECFVYFPPALDIALESSIPPPSAPLHSCEFDSVNLAEVVKDLNDETGQNVSWVFQQGNKWQEQIGALSERRP